jgi:hypothetical protein
MALSGAAGSNEHRSGRGYMMVTSDGRGAVAYAAIGKDAVAACCEALGQDQRYIMGTAR